MGRRKILKKEKMFGIKRCSSKIVWLVIGLLVLVAFLIYYFLLIPQIQLKGDIVTVLNYKEKYKEKGFKATFLGEDITKKVKVSGNVNSKKLGTYELIYKVRSGVFTRKVIRKVVVQDKSAPSIELVSRKDIYVCPGDEYEEEKYMAFDNYDGDVTDEVKVIKKKNKIIYRVQDTAGNKSEVTRKIIYEDREEPVITLNGSEIIYAFLGEKYLDKGYSAVDNCDGDLLKNVKVSGKVNSNALGEYNINYIVADKSGNIAEVSRKVIVSKRGEKGTIYLTFDDGPKQGTTNVILDILKEEGIEATFFVTNSGPDELIKRAYDEGHSVALHTASHNYALVYSSIDNYFDDLFSVQERVKRITGEEAKIIRFPGGASNTISRRYKAGIMSELTREVLNRGFKYYDWNISSGDAAGGSPTSTEIYNNVISKLSKERVNMVLLHDIKACTRDALEDIIKYGKDNGYTFEKITMDTEMITQRVNN